MVRLNTNPDSNSFAHNGGVAFLGVDGERGESYRDDGRGDGVSDPTTDGPVQFQRRKAPAPTEISATGGRGCSCCGKREASAWMQAGESRVDNGTMEGKNRACGGAGWDCDRVPQVRGVCVVGGVSLPSEIFFQTRAEEVLRVVHVTMSGSYYACSMSSSCYFIFQR